MPSSRNLPLLLPAVLKISEEAQSKIEGGILKLLPIFLLLAFFYSFVLPFLFKMLFQIDNSYNYMAIWIKQREIQHLPSTAWPVPGGRGFPLAPSLLKTDALPPDSIGNGYLGNHKSLSLQLPKWAENNLSLRRRVPSWGLKKGFKIQEWNHHENWNYRIFDKSVLFHIQYVFKQSEEEPIQVELMPLKV